MNSELDKLYAQRMNAISEIEDTPADGEIIFDVENRTINSSGVQDVIVQNDNICRTIKFRMRRYFEEVDRSTKSVSVRYTNPLGESDEAFGSSRITGIDYITFNWVISNKATSASGELQFDILFYDGNDYNWYTKPAILIVEKGLKVTTITPKPSQDWIDSWRSEAGQYLLDYQRLENSVNNVIDTLEKRLEAQEIRISKLEQLLA